MVYDGQSRLQLVQVPCSLPCPVLRCTMPSGPCIPACLGVSTTHPKLPQEVRYVHLQALPMLIFWETRRKDFAETFAHHVATLALIVYSHHVKWVPFWATSDSSRM